MNAADADFLDEIPVTPQDVEDEERRQALPKPGLLDDSTDCEPRFRETGTCFVCLVCGDIGQIDVQDFGVSSCGAVEPASHWATGEIVCPGCGAREPWGDSS